MQPTTVLQMMFHISSANQYIHSACLCSTPHGKRLVRARAASAQCSALSAQACSCSSLPCGGAPRALTCWHARDLLSCLSTSTVQVVLQPTPVALMPVPTARPRQLKQAPTVLKHTDRRCELHAHRQWHSTSANSPHGWHAFPVLYQGHLATHNFKCLPFGNAQLREAVRA